MSEGVVPYRIEKADAGYLRAVPRPTVAELEAFYREKYFQKPSGSYQPSYSADELAFFRNAGRLAHATLERHDIQRSFLDLGCGEGFFGAALVELGWDAACCDWSSYGLEHFNPQLMPGFVRCGAEDMVEQASAQGRRFGLVNLQNVLEHVLEPEQLLRSLRGVIASRGMLRIRVPNDFSAFQKYLVNLGMTEETWVCPPEHLNYFNSESLPQLLQACGYEMASLQCNFPIELFLLNEHSNYASDRARGKAAHRARVQTENFLVTAGLENYLDYAEAAAKLGFGRELIAYARPREAHP